MLRVVAADVLPECRAKRRTGDVWVSGMGWMARTYCANCGAPGHFVSADATVAFIQCDACAEKYGHPAHFMVEKDHEFLERIENERQRRSLTFDDPVALLKAMEDKSDPLRLLARDWQRYVSSFT
jgi:hypothetical protein